MRASRSRTAAGGRFVTAAVTQGYAPLDRYLMGFAPAERRSRHVRGARTPAPTCRRSAIRRAGWRLPARRLNISASDVIQAMGRRTPDYTVAQHRFRFGFILVVPPGAADSSLTASRAAGGNVPAAVRRVLHQVLREPGRSRYYFEPQHAAVTVPGGRRGGGRQGHRNDFRADAAQDGSCPLHWRRQPDLCKCRRRSRLPRARPAPLLPSRVSRPEWRNCWRLPPIRVTKLPSRACRWQRRRNSRCEKRSAIPFQERRGAVDRRQRTAVPRGAHCSGSHKRQRDAPRSPLPMRRVSPVSNGRPVQGASASSNCRWRQRPPSR